MPSNSDNSLWVFGYGSLCWHPGFDYGDQIKGHIQGFARKFWQGNTTHRGTPDKPGRVATLVEDRKEVTHGLALKLKDQAALDYLNNREVTLGGYVSHITMFYPRDKSREPFPILLYIATSTNVQWLGPAPLDDVAEQVVTCSGNTGHNVEYVLRLADWIRAEMPEAMDDHLFTLEKIVKAKVKSRKLCLATMMGEKPSQVSTAAAPVAPAHHDENSNSKPKVFANSVSHSKLRCRKV